MAVVGFHPIWGKGSAAERGGLTTAALKVPYYFFETDTELLWYWDGSGWCQFASTGALPDHAHEGVAGDGNQLDHGDANTGASLLDDDHPQYAQIAQAETIAGLWTHVWSDANDDVSELLILERALAAGLPTADALGGRVTYRSTDGGGGQDDLGYIDWLWSDAGAGTEDGYFDFKLMEAGAAAATKFQIRHNGPSIPYGERLTFGDLNSSIRETADNELTIEIEAADLFVLDHEGIKAPTRIMEMIWPDYPLNDATEGDHFRQNAATYPAGWTETDAAQQVTTAMYNSAWYIRGTAANASYDYRLQSGVDIENDIGANEWASFTFGPIFWRDGKQPAADIDYWFSIHGETAAAIDLTEYNRVHLQWDSGAQRWQIQGESNNGGGETASGWLVLDENPLHQPIWVRIVIRNNAGVMTCRSYWGTTPYPHFHTQFQSVGENTTWGTVFWRISQTRGAGIEDYLLVGGIDFDSNMA